MIVEKLIKILYNNKEFVKPFDLTKVFKIDEKTAFQILEQAEVFGVAKLCLNHQDWTERLYTTTPNQISDETKKEFQDFLNENFPIIIEHKIKKLNQELTELRDEILQDLLLKQRNIATEKLVNKIEKENYIYTTKDDKISEVWIYKEGIYKPNGESSIKEFCRLILGHVYTTQMSNEIIEKIKADTYIEADDFFKKKYIFEVPILEGILNIKTKKVSPFTPKKIFFNKLPISYNPNSECPNIKKHFETILKKKDDSKVIFELFGYLLLKENKFEKAFMFVGHGRNGKTKTLELMKRFLGVDNCCALPLKSMHEESFSLSELFGKMVNLAGDLSSTDLKSTGTIKNLIGRDTIQAKRKFLRDLNFVNYAKMIFACNELPKVFDLTDGFWTKWLLLEFPYKFITQKEFDKLSEKERENKKIINTEIIKELTTSEELSGLLNKALDSLKNILENKEFSYSKGTQEVKDIWIRVSNSFTAFCNENLEEDYNSKISKKDLRKEYFKYCKKYRLRGAGDKEIKVTLQNLFGVVESREFQGENQWDGIKYNSNRGFSTYREVVIYPLGEKTPVTPVYKKISKGTFEESENNTFISNETNNFSKLLGLVDFSVQILKNKEIFNLQIEKNKKYSLDNFGDNSEKIIDILIKENKIKEI